MSKNESLEKAWKDLSNEYHPTIVEVMKEALTTAQEVQEKSVQTAIRDRIIEGLDERISPEGILDKDLAEDLITQAGEGS